MTKQLRPKMEEPTTEKNLIININQEELNELEEKLRSIFMPTPPTIQEGNVERNSLPKTVLSKLEQVAANTVLKEEIDKIQSDMITINAAIYAMATLVIQVHGQRKKPGKASQNVANKTMTKMQQQLKEMKKLTSKTASEIDRRKKSQKASNKEKENIELLKRKIKITRGDLSIEALTKFKHQCLNNIKILIKTATISRRKNNMEFEKSEAASYKYLKQTKSARETLPTLKNLKTSGLVFGKQKERSTEKSTG